MRLWPFLIAGPLFLLALLTAVPSCRAQGLVGEATFSAFTYDNGADGPLVAPGFAFFDSAANELVVASPGNQRIVFYDTSLSVKFSFLHYIRDKSGKGLVLGEPRAAVVNKRGEVLVLDNLADYIDVLDFRGSPIDRIYPNRLLKDSTLKIHPELIALDKQDNLYLSISGDIQAILVLDRDFEFKRKIISKGTPDAPDLPVSLAVMDSMIILGDMQGKPVIRIYDTLGHYLSGFGGREIERTDFSLPIAIVPVTDSAGAQYFLVADALRQVIKLLDQRGQLVSMIGGYGAGLGAFQYPSGLAYGGMWTFFVVERVSGRVQKFVLK